MPSYELSQLAESDLEHILEYTFVNFGKNQMYKYKRQLEHCLKILANNVPSYRRLDIDGKYIRSLHCQMHFLFALERQNRPLLIVAVLHERMDLVKRIRDRL